MRTTMCGLVRLYCYMNGVTNVFDYPVKEARQQRKRLSQEGWVVYHSVVV